MREIKFRAWDKYKGLSLPFKLGGYPEWPDGSRVPYWASLTVKEQFTGLHDKNGVEIYEGDIIQGPFDRIGIVELHWSWWVKYIRHDSGTTLKKFYHPHTGSSVQVIGNIHNNPELLS